MEFGILFVLVLSVATNLYILRAKLQPSIFVNAVIPESSPLINVEVPEPVVHIVPSAVGIDYGKIEDILKRVTLLSLEYQQKVPIPTPIPQTPQYIPVNENTNTFFDGHTLATNINIEGVPAKQYPRNA